MISNLFIHKVSTYLQNIHFFYPHPKLILKKNKTFLDFIKRILIEFEFTKEKNSIWSTIYKLQKNDFGLHFIKKKNKIPQL